MKTTVAMVIIACGALASCELQQPDAVAQNDVNKNTVSERAAVFVAEGVTYTGSTSADGQVDSFLGIPFAEAPVDDLRWMPPRPVSLSGQVDARKFSAACMQGPHLVNWYKNLITFFGGDPATFTVPPVSEDCLYLNIWRPRAAATTAAQAPLPVFVFIHGGSNKGGWSIRAQLSWRTACPARGDRCHDCLPRRGVRIFCPPAAGAGQFRPAGSNRGVDLGATAHRGAGW